jgi:hypothetical protein
LRGFGQSADHCVEQMHRGRRLYCGHSLIWSSPPVDRRTTFAPQLKCLWCPEASCYPLDIIKSACIVATLIFGLVTPLAAQDPVPSYDFRERTRALAFDPGRFFPERSQSVMSVRYLGDDYAYPVYAIAVRKGCTREDQGTARQTCGERLTARMVRSTFQGIPPRPRARGQRLFGAIAREQPKSDEALLRLLDKGELEWLEADVLQCPPAMAHLATSRDLQFSPVIDQSEPSEIVLHADRITFEVSDYLVKSRYEGWLKPGSPGAWAYAFAASLEACWKPSTAIVPWRVATD